MGRSVIVINVAGLDGMIDAMERVGKPGFVATQALESVLGAAFAQTQADTHIITGRLKASGRTESDYNNKVWTGSIHYGGHDYPVPGYNGETAYYAGYEKKRGGEHDFLAGLEVYGDKIPDAMSEWFKVAM